ncbi:aspartate kinase [Haoranjiania flava]|uniref:Aspartokinase n=1 Tax=Haoranjiania flava TaxID=1856322 RepID=A0AAE3IN40_9BACT|nr:aspartate kinase [Haoranjiania flava]MCU7694115.1 aspartate kinase [Haoranjiania flava]
MKVFKFGGASIKDVDHIRHVANIVREYSTESPLLLIMSASGKTTNALEKVVENFYNGNSIEALKLFDDIKRQHLDIAKYLLVLNFNVCLEKMVDLFTEVEWLLHDKPVWSYDYYYDQVVCIGELLSTTIISAYFNEAKIGNTLVDVRDVLRTDNNFRDAVIDWQYTAHKTAEIILPAIEKNGIVITQGFIGSTDENESTTLGREGSDYSAAVFSNILNAQELVIWKDVEGVMNADPRKFPSAQYLQHLSYAEAIEMAYYGAQVIHPKTIKPLQNKNIPLYVKCFLDTGLPGTLINSEPVRDLPAILISKENQALVYFKTIDFSFISGHPMNSIQQILEKLQIKPNLVQTEAISMEMCFDDNAKLDTLAQEASVFLEVQLEKGLRLITLRHYQQHDLDNHIQDKDVILLQRTQNTVQAVVR